MLDSRANGPVTERSRLGVITRLQQKMGGLRANLGIADFVSLHMLDQKPPSCGVAQLYRQGHRIQQ